jgi:adenine-specific DNA-methyltransferase
MFDINNRRYLGSKFKLLGFIDEVIGMHCKASTTLTDLFGGTGVVAYHFNNRYDVKVNDTLLANYVSYLTFFDNELINHEKLRQYIEYYNQLPILNKENYYSKNFADTFLSRENMWKVGDIRDDIDFQFKEKSINARERAILITSLIYAIDKIANTVGHYDAYRRNGELDKILLLKFPNIDDKHNKDNEIYNLDANQLVKQIQSDIVYIDPPYNSRQYCDAYHFIENVANNSKPEVLGVARNDG